MLRGWTRHPCADPRERRTAQSQANSTQWLGPGLSINNDGQISLGGITAVHPLYFDSATATLIVNSNSSESLFIGGNENTTATGTRNIAIGSADTRFGAITTGHNNIGIGNTVEGSSFGSPTLTTGSNNVFIGTSIGSGTTATSNVFIGFRAGSGVTTGDNNVALGEEALKDCAGDTDHNVAIGTRALRSQGATADRNIAIGYEALADNTNNATNCIAIGEQSMDSPDGACTYCVAIGYRTLREPTADGQWNVAIGFEAMGTSAAVSGEANVCIGYQAGTAVTSGLNNVAIGVNAGDAITSGNRNVIIGSGADVNSGSISESICLGRLATAKESNLCVLGGAGTGAVAPGFGRTTAPADASIDNSFVYLYWNDSTSRIWFKGKDSGGAVTDMELGSGGGSDTILTTGPAAFEGALVYLSGNLTGFTSETAIPWEAASYDTEHDPADGGASQRFWLGANFTFATGDVNTGTEEITETGHGFTTGEGPVWFSSSGSLPAGLSASTNYWIIVVDANTFKVATSRANALAGTAIDLTTQGTGTHTCVKATRLVVPAGVTKVRLTGGTRTNTSDASGNQYLLRIQKNGASTYPGGSSQETDTAGTDSVNVSSPVLDVSEGDYFELVEFGTSANTLLANQTWFGIQALDFTNIATSARVSSQFDATTDTLANVTGLSLNVLGSRTYAFHAYLFLDADATGGIKLAIAGTATATAIRYDIQATDIGAPGVERITARHTSLGSSSTAAGQTAYLAEINGTITVNAGGTLTCQFAQSTANGTSSVLTGSTLTIEELA